MALNRSELAAACDAGTKYKIDLLLKKGDRLSQVDGRASFLNLIVPIKSPSLRDELLTAFINHFKPSKRKFLSQQADAWVSFLSLAMKYNNGTLLCAVCGEIYSNSELYQQMKRQMDREEFKNLFNKVNAIYGEILLHRAEALVNKYKNSYFYSAVDEKRITPTIWRINDYFKTPEVKFNDNLRIARNNLVECQIRLSRDAKTITPQNDSPWKQLTHISNQLNFSFFQPNPHGVPGDQRPKTLNIAKF